MEKTQLKQQIKYRTLPGNYFMNKYVIVGISFLGIFSLVDTSFASFPTQIGDDIFIFVQTSLRNSDGQLITYLESSKFTNVNPPALDSFLDFEASRGNDPIVTIDDQQYQIIRRVQTQLFDSKELVASTNLYDNLDGDLLLLARFAHDGYTTIPGDTLESMWTFIRPVS